ncbi:MAG: chemotaxis protein CheW [Gammaproteobacteria bacterium]
MSDELIDGRLESAEKKTEELMAMMDSDLDPDADQFLSFFLDGAEYGIDILRVQEIKCWDYATEIPNSPSFVKGVINLRGTIVPVVDLRLRFGLEAVDYTINTVVIVLRVENDGNERTIGFIVDGVSEVYSVEKNLLQAQPESHGDFDVSFIEGLFSNQEKMVVMLDVDKLASINT